MKNVESSIMIFNSEHGINATNLTLIMRYEVKRKFRHCYLYYM
jgi:hypothetical protein